MAIHSAPSRKTRWSILMATAAAAFMASSAQAGYSITTTAGPFTDSTGNPLTSGSLVVLVVDLGRDGVALPTATDFAPGADDQVFATSPTTTIGGNSVLFDSFSDNSITIGNSTAANLAIDAGDPIAMFWYPDLTQQQFLTDSNDSTSWDLSAGPGNTSYGSFNLDGSDSSWVFPLDGTPNVSVQLLSEGLQGSVPNDQLANVFRASSATGGGPVIPEPSSALLLLAGSSIFFLRRNRA